MTNKANPSKCEDIDILSAAEKLRQSTDVSLLHPDLKPHFITDKEASERGIMPGLYHKLVHQPFFVWVEHANAAYEYKSQCAEQCLSRNDIDGYLALVEKPYRLEELLYHAHLIPDDAFMDTFLDVWIAIENVWQYREPLEAFLHTHISRQPLAKRFDPNVDLIEDKDELITIYRGYNPKHEPNGDGLSYTVRLETAQGFSKRWFADGKVRVRKVRKERIAFTTQRRGEDEVVLLPTGGDDA
jgi:hypothetical protein